MSTSLLSPGVTLNERYEISSYLASGGMQDVYIANDKSLDRKVVVKTPKAEARKRFKRGGRDGSSGQSF